MVLGDASEPIFRERGQLRIGKKHISRQMYRCPRDGCAMVAAGPTEVTHALRELTLEMVNPY
jgi:hypothetical protein